MTDHTATSTRLDAAFRTLMKERAVTDLQSLHRALSEAESGSRELDWAIHVEGGSQPPRRAGAGWPDPNDLIIPCTPGWRILPRYTTDLNAITSLIERKLPGWRIASNSDYDRSPLWCAAVKQRGESWDGRWQCAPTEPLARAIALVSALIAQESEK